MNWYKQSNSDHMNLLMNFYNYLTNSMHERKTLEEEIIYLYHTPEESARHEYVREIIQVILGELNIRFQNILSIPKDFFEYYVKGDKYSTHDTIVESLMQYIQKSKQSLDKVNVERQNLNYDSKYNIYQFQKSIKSLNSNLNQLHRILKYAIIENNDLGEKVVIQEFNQLNIDGEPAYKEVRKDQKPPWGHGWRTQNPSTGEWEWWKTNWDTSD